LARSKLELGKGYYKAHQYGDAIESISELLKSTEKDHLTLVRSEALVCLALSYLKSGKSNRSVKVAKEVLDHRLKFSSNSNALVGKAYYCLGIAYIGTGNIPLAKKNFESAIQFLGNAYRKKRTSRAGRALSDCHFRMAQIWNKERNLRQCEKSFTSALQIQKQVIVQDHPFVRYEDGELYKAIFLWGKAVRFNNQKFGKQIDFHKEYKFLWKLQTDSEDYRTARTVSVADGYYQELLVNRKFSEALKICEVATEILDELPEKKRNEPGLFLAKFLFLERQATVYYYLGSAKNQKLFLGKAIDEMRRIVGQNNNSSRKKLIHATIRYCKSGKKIWIGDFRKSLLGLEKELN